MFSRHCRSGRQAYYPKPCLCLCLPALGTPAQPTIHSRFPVPGIHPLQHSFPFPHPPAFQPLPFCSLWRLSHLAEPLDSTRVLSHTSEPGIVLDSPIPTLISGSTVQLDSGEHRPGSPCCTKSQESVPNGSGPWPDAWILAVWGWKLGALQFALVRPNLRT